MPRGSRQTVRRTADRQRTSHEEERSLKPCSFSEFLYIEIVLNYRSNANLLGLSPQEKLLAGSARSMDNGHYSISTTTTTGG